MADVMALVSERPQDMSRGQLLLIAGLALGVILVTVALLLNAAIFTENVATRDTTADGGEALALRGSVVTGVGELIERENRHGGSDVENRVEAGVDSFVMESATDVGPHPAREQAQRGAAVSVTRNGSVTSGTVLAWSSPDSDTRFDSVSTNWTLVDDVTDTRAFSLTLSTSDLVPLSAPNGSQLAAAAFGIQLSDTDSTTNVTQYIYRDSGDVVVAQVTDDDDPEARCRIEDTGEVTVDLTADRLANGETTVRCLDGLWPPFDLDSISFVNGEAAFGTFSVTVTDDASPTSSTSVSKTDAVYAVAVDISYLTADLDFETTVMIAPGEPR